MVRTRLVARQGDGTVRRAGQRRVDSATVVIDPRLPEELRDALVRAGGKLVPYQGPVPARRRRPTARGCAFAAGIFFILAIAGVGTGSGALAYVMLMFAWHRLPDGAARPPSATEIEAAHAPVTQHRRTCCRAPTSTPSTGSCGSERSTRGTGLPAPT
jgi:hypothetical protein